MINSCEERRAGPSNEFYQMNILSESNELLNIEKQENVVKNVQINCCANLQCWKANNNANNTVTEEDTKRTSCLDKLKGIHVIFKIIAVLVGIIIALSPIIPKIVAEIKTTETTMPSDVFILVIPSSVDKSYLQSGDGSSQISATINAPENNYATQAAHALVNGKMHIFGGYYDNTKIARLDDCTFNELTVRLNEEREAGHAALSIENGKKALICFGSSGGVRRTCEIFDGSTTVSTFASDWTHQRGGLGLYKISRRVLDASTWNIKKLKCFLSRLAGFRFRIIQNAFLRTASSLWRINRCCLSAELILEMTAPPNLEFGN